MILLFLAAVTTDSSVAAMNATYDRLCLHGGASAAAILSAADRDGWSSQIRGAPTGFDPAHKRWKAAVDGPVVVSAYQTGGAGQTMVSCGVEVSGARPSLDEAVGVMTGVAPVVEFPNASTRIARREGDRWRDTKSLSHEAFARANAAGEVYSVMTMTAPTRAAVFSLNPRPEDPPVP